MYNQGDIVLIPVPFTDLSSNKKRPVLILSSEHYNKATDDFIAAAITSNIDEKPYSITIKSDDLSEGNLLHTSCVRTDKLYTLAQSIVIKKFGTIKEEFLKLIIEKMYNVFTFPNDFIEYKGRCQCIVVRENKILMVKHVQNGESWLCLPGDGTEKNETYEEGALRELLEECNVSGKIIRKTSEIYENINDGIARHVTFYVDIGEQAPRLGIDPEVTGVPILQSVGWYELNEICERDRTFLWAAGLYQIEEIAKELSSWGDAISYPNKKYKTKPKGYI